MTNSVQFQDRSYLHIVELNWSSKNPSHRKISSFTVMWTGL